MPELGDRKFSWETAFGELLRRRTGFIGPGWQTFENLRERQTIRGRLRRVHGLELSGLVSGQVQIERANGINQMVCLDAPMIGDDTTGFDRTDTG